MRIFINNVDSYVGRALCADLRSVHDMSNKLLGTVMSEKVDNELMQTMGVKRVVSRAQPRVYLKDVLTCSLIVYDLHSADPTDVETVIKHLKVAELEHETTFVLISSVNAWAKTRKEFVPVETEEDEQEEELDDEGNPIGKDPKMRPKELTDQDIDRRIPSQDHEQWKYLETLALSLSSREKLRPHVIASGILYGNGETTFNELFKAAWLTQSYHKIIRPGDNYIPCVHVRDVARLVKVVAVDKTVGNYLIAVDKARLTQAEIVQGIVNQISNAVEVPVHDETEVECDFKDVMKLNLIMTPSAPMLAKSFPWWCKHGLVKNVEKVAAEFCKWRNLRPIKMIVVGPPGAGAERFCSMVAERYLHEDPPHLTFSQILQDALKKEDAVRAKDPEAPGRLREKYEKASSTPGAKLSLKTRTRLVKKRLMSNVCRYRGYVLEGYPENYEEADALFTEIVVPEGEDPPPEEPEEEEEEEEEEPPAAKDEDEDEDEGEPKPQRKLNEVISPEFVVQLKSSQDKCKTRIFSGAASGAQSEQEFLRKSAEYQKANLAEDGSRGTQDFFVEGAGLNVLHVDVDKSNETEVFDAMRVYMESKGQFFNYLRSEEELVREREEEVAKLEREKDARREKATQDRHAAEQSMREKAAGEEAHRRQAINESEAALLEGEAMPLRQYLLSNVVPTLSEGLTEVCKEQPEDPIEYLAQYLFAHAQDIAPALQQQGRKDGYRS